MVRAAVLILALTLPSMAAAQAGPVGAPGRYVIVHSPHKQADTVLLDTLTGKTWQLQHTATRDADIWVPLARSDNPGEMAPWLQDNPVIPSQAQPAPPPAPKPQ